MKVKEIAEKTDKELETVIEESRKELAKFAVEIRTGKVANIKAAAANKRTIARALTILREREIAKEEQSNG